MTSRTSRGLEPASILLHGLHMIRPRGNVVERLHLMKRIARWALPLALALTLCSAIAALGASAPAKAPRTGAAKGKGKGRPAWARKLYVGDPFPGDSFRLKVAKDARRAVFVGHFSYSNPGCPGAAFGNEFLTPSSAPAIRVSARGAFSGTKTTGGYTDQITGRFTAKTAKTTFRETERCAGDKPLVLKFTMRAR